MIHLQSSPDIMTQIPLFGGVIFALVNVLKRIWSKIDGGWTLVVALLLAIVFGSVIAFAEFQVVRDFVYGVFSLFLAALGVHASQNLSAGEVADQSADQSPDPAVTEQAELTEAMAPVQTTTTTTTNTAPMSVPAPDVPAKSRSRASKNAG